MVSFDCAVTSITYSRYTYVDDDFLTTHVPTTEDLYFQLNKDVAIGKVFIEKYRINKSVSPNFFIKDFAQPISRAIDHPGKI